MLADTRMRQVSAIMLKQKVIPAVALRERLPAIGTR